MNKIIKIFGVVILVFFGCENSKPPPPSIENIQPKMCASFSKSASKINPSYLKEINQLPVDQALANDFSGMVKIKNGEFVMGGNNPDDLSSIQRGSQPRPDEFPNNKITIKEFWMDETEVTNAQFEKFVNASGYLTTAERPISMDEIMAQLPAGSPKPNPCLLYTSPSPRDATLSRMPSSA